MKNLIETQNECEVVFADSIFSGYGHRKITVELRYKDNYKKFSAVTNCMPCTDEAYSLEGQEKYDAFFNIIENSIEEEISEWLHFECD